MNNNFIRFFLRIPYLIITISPVYSAHATLMLDGTRAIFHAGENEALIRVENPSDNDFLMQSWIDASDGKNQTKLLVEPPIAQIKAHQKVTLRISLIDPKLKKSGAENLFWLNVKEIPKINSDSASSDLILAMQTRIKVFFRPENIPIEQGDAWRKLTWQYKGETLTMSNPTPYYITINKAFSGEHGVLDADMVAPFSTVTVHGLKKSPGKIRNITYDTIGDFGDVSDKVSSVVR